MFPNPVHRFDQPRFIAYGLLTGINAIALALYALGLATHGRGSAADAQPVLFVLIILCLLGAGYASVLRGHDLGRPGWQLFLAFWLALGGGPVFLVLLGYLAWAKGEPGSNAYGPSPTRAGMATWFWAAFWLASPWLVFAIAVLIAY
jgi:uncharacterized membrane protein YhaH (DUF805 family)